MTLPIFERFFFPFLKSLQDGQPRHYRDIKEIISRFFGLTEEDRAEVVPHGGNTRLRDRTEWAGNYLKRAGLVMKHARATYKITDRGKAVLEEASDLTLADLNRYQRLQPTATVENEDEVQLDDAEITPDEIIERNYRDSESILSQELLERVKSSPPDFFERLVIDLLVAMGYGGSREDAGRSIGRTGDGGVDGLIKEDPLGIEMLYVQAKRWRNAVGRPLVQAFVGSLEGYHARRGVMATTSKFTDDAEEYIRTIEKRIVLIDGKKLVSLMMGYGIGVSTSQKYEMHKIDNGYFPED